MNKRRIAMITAALLALALAGGCATTQKVQVDLREDAGEPLRAMAALFEASDYIRFSGRDWNDVPQPDGHLIQLQGTFTMTLASPDRLRADVSLGPHDISLWYDAGQVTVYGRNREVWAEKASGQDLDTFLDDLVEDYNVTLPGQDFLYSDTLDLLLEDAESGRRIGIATVRERPCHHLVFRQDQIDWEIWIDAGEQPVPRRLLIDEKTTETQRGYLAEFEEWSFEPVAGDDPFEPDISGTAEKISLDAFWKLMEEAK